ncbi:MAG: exodeoxyribonuclease III [Polyangiaceae bacterium]|nr:exodeoxyribonuclease III [Polyangiaceae bacterium]
MKLATWNVNSIRAREALVLAWVRRHEPDVLCLQETKVVDDDFPAEPFQRLGYTVAAAGQRTYNGVAILSRRPLRDPVVGLVGARPTEDKRLLAATVDGVRVLCAYVPNGKSTESPSFRDKLAWLGRLRETLDASCRPEADVAVVGDFNVAFDERDVWDPERFRGQLFFTDEERAALGRVLEFGLFDAYRHHHAERAFTWWDYRGAGFERDLGMRIDHVLLSASALARCRSATIDVEARRGERPSDHAPVVVELE